MMKKLLSRIPNLILLLLLLGITLGSGCSGPAVLSVTFATSPQVLNVGIVSGIMTIQIEDGNGAPVNLKTDTDFNLTSTSPTGRFSLSQSFSWYITSMTVPSGSSSTSFYYKDTTAGSPTITATESPSQGWTAGTQTQNVNSGPLDHFSFAAIANQTNSAAFNVTITAQDTYGNTVTSYSGINSLSDTTGTITPITTGAFNNGVWTDKITIASAQSKVTITTSGGGKNGTSNEFNVVAGTISKLAFSSAPQILAAGDLTGEITLQSQDASNNPYNAAENTVIHLTSNSARGTFYSDAAGLNPITLVTINAGSSSASFFYKDTTAGSPIITATESPSQGWTAATQSQNVNSAALDHFSFAVIADQTQNNAFNVTITALDTYGNTVTSYSGANSLTDTTGTITPATTGAFKNGTWSDKITIASIQNKITITTSGGDKSGVSNEFNIVTAPVVPKLAFSSAPQTLAAGDISGIITVTVQDNVTSNTTINLTTSSNKGTFYNDAAGLNPITLVTINAGSSSASFYFKDTTAGSPTITATESPSQGWTATTQAQNVNPAALDHFSFAVIADQTQNNAFNVAITALDTYGNTVTYYSDINSLTDTTGTITPATTGAFNNGTWSDKITIASIQNKITITTSGGDKSGVSNEFNIVAGTISKLAFTSAPQTLTAGNMSGIITITTQDNVTENTTINLSSSSASGTFYSDVAGLNPITQITINAGSNSANFYYKDATAGSPTITASSAQGLTAAIQTQTINPVPVSEITPKTGFSTSLVIIIGIGGIILGLLVGYVIFSRIKRAAVSTKKEITVEKDIETRQEKKPEATPQVNQVIAIPKKQAPEVNQRKAEPPAVIKQTPAPEVSPKKAETPRAARRAEVPEPASQKIDTVSKQKDQIPEVPQKIRKETATAKDSTSELKKEPATAKDSTSDLKKEPTAAKDSTFELKKEPVTAKDSMSELLIEVEANSRIAATSAKDNLVAFQTKAWESKREEINALPANIMEELTRAYSAISLANSLVWLAAETGRHSPSLDDQYAKLCKGIAERLDKVKQPLEQERFNK